MTIDHHAIGSARCARGHWFEDQVIAIQQSGGWCPICDGPAQPPGDAPDDPRFRRPIRTGIIWVEQHDEVRVLRPCNPRAFLRYAVVPTDAQDQGRELPSTKPQLCLSWHRVEAVEHWPHHVILFLADGSRVTESPGTQLTLRRPF